MYSSVLKLNTQNPLPLISLSFLFPSSYSLFFLTWFFFFSTQLPFSPYFFLSCLGSHTHTHTQPPPYVLLIALSLCLFFFSFSSLSLPFFSCLLFVRFIALSLPFLISFSHKFLSTFAPSYFFFFTHTHTLPQ